ncbi:PD-(D/E)XK nuclease family protein [Myxosarcina sp. GI1]|uniref:PD-(D/E)XK nuclease family protein n=1 Tax=Myxosarcina sp. GI1 TaxID=1541065 RepID=UPI000560600D|nr:PD-(D/E)XK nuclease family protein [Myxosarcina sp. GI1]
MHRYIVSEIGVNSASQDLKIITSSKAIANYLKVPHCSLESLAQNVVRRQGWNIASALLSRRWLQDAVREIVGTHDVTGTARAFLTPIRELFHSGSDLKVLQQNSSPKIQQLANLALAYQQRLRSQNYLDPAEVFWHGGGTPAAYLFYGYLIPARDELAFIDTVAGDGSIIVLPAESRAIAWLQDWGWVLGNGVKSTLAASSLVSPHINPKNLPENKTLHSYSNLDAEVRGVLTQVKALLNEGVKAKDIVLVARDERLYGETLIDIAWEYQLPIRVWYEVALEATRVGAWLKLLMEVIETEFAFEATAKLLFHPLVKQMSAEVWERARTTHPQSFKGWQELGLDLNLLNFPQTSSRKDWIGRLLEIFSSWEILENSKKWAREILAFYRVKEALQELTKPELATVSKQTFIRDIKETLALLCVPAQPGRGGVELHAPTSLYGTKYKYVFVLGMAEGMFPQSLSDDPRLDFCDRRQLARQGFNIDTAINLAQREAFICSSLLAIPQQKIIFSYPQSLAKDTLLPSTYLTNWGLQPQPVINLPLASVEAARRRYLRQPEQLQDSLLPQIAKAWQVELNRELAPIADEYDGVIGIKIAPESKILSASQLTQLGQCPFKWFSRRLLRLQELSEAELDLSAAFRGNLYHRCLELSLENVATAADLENFNREQLERAFIRAEEELELTQLPGWEVQRQEHLKLLALNLSASEFLPSDCQVIAREREFAFEWHNLQIQGKVDRIDRTAEGLAVIDYKTSSTKPVGVKDKTGKANLDLQLALYAEAIAKVYPEASVTATYYSLTKRQAFKRPKTDSKELAAFAERVKSHLDRGYYPVDPDVDNKACNYCAFDLVCRKGDRLSRKRSFPVEPSG